MSRVVRNIFIIGSKLEHFEHIEDLFIERTGKFFEYHFFYGSWEDLFTQVETMSFCSIFIDFSLTKSTELFVTCFNKVKFLKNTEAFNKTPLAGFFDDKEIVLENSYILKSGINYFHMIGDDLNLFFGNFYYSAFEDEDYCLKLARATKLEVKTTFEHRFYISRINSFSARIEGDINLDEEFCASITNAFDGKKLKMEQTDQLADAEITSDLNCYDVEFDFEDSWDDTGDIEPVFEDEVVNWISNLDNDKEIENTQQVNVHLYSTSTAWALDLVSNSELNSIQPKVFSQFDENHLGDFSEPEFIIFECKTDKQLDDVDLVMTYYSNQGTKPVILLRNHPSKTEAIKKMYEYDSVISYGGNFTNTEFSQMVNMLRVSKNIPKCKRFKIEKNIYMLQLALDTIVTSLSENEVTFKTKVDIPFFTHLVLNMNGVHVYLTIIPPYFDLSPNIGGFHYLAMINFCEEYERQTLRKSVRRFVGNLPAEWNDVNLIGTEEELKSTIGKDHSEPKVTVEAPKAVAPKSNIFQKEERGDKTKSPERKRTQGRKSKL